VVFVREGRRRDSFDELSDGYQSMLVLVCDVMNTVMSLWPSPSQAEGIVLIDELGAHLHPRWRMRIVGALREILPRVQFVMTTHDPLCLRGLEDGEVIVVRRNESGKVVTISDLPPVKGLRVEQLLTSEHFGLGSTEDPEVDALFREYYILRARKRPTKAQRQRIIELETRLGELRQFGTTERERLLLRSADAFIAERREEGDAVATQAVPAPSGLATEAVMKDLLAIWSEVLPTTSPASTA
jgi:predicted ATP-binding protein involved in virulence